VITGDPNILVLGSQSILGSFGEEVLPPEATGSIEADVAFMDDPEEGKSDKVDGGIGEESRFHERFGVYGQGVGDRPPSCQKVGGKGWWPSTILRRERVTPSALTHTTSSSPNWSRVARRTTHLREP
jgi:hypothetical protein